MVIRVRGALSSNLQCTPHMIFSLHDAPRTSKLATSNKRRYRLGGDCGTLESISALQLQNDTPNVIITRMLQLNLYDPLIKQDAHYVG